MATSRQAEAASPWRAPILLAVLVVLFVLEGTMRNALFSGSWNTSLAILNMGLISAIMALGVNMQWGYAGLFNSGVVGFLALGGLAPVLISVAPVQGAWSAGGLRVLSALVVGLGTLGLAGSTTGLILVHVVYGIGFSTLYFRNYYAAFPTELVRAAMMDGAGFFRIFWRIMLPVSGPIAVVCIIWQFTNIWNDFLFGASFADLDSMPMTVALNNLVNSSTGVKAYNVDFAGAILAALPTLLVYIVAGRYFVRGLMAGSVKG